MMVSRKGHVGPRHVGLEKAESLLQPRTDRDEVVAEEGHDDDRKIPPHPTPSVSL